MGRSHLPALKPYHPTTFRERGVSVPFTTPLLGGTRARPTEKQRVELVIPNPSGGRGAYVMAWTGISTWCQPTLHDAVFNERVAALRTITPATIRRTALQIAAEGLAGDEAMQAAAQMVKTETSDRLVTNYRLLMNLVSQVGQISVPDRAEGGYHKNDLMKQARMTVDWISPRLGQPATWTASALEALSDVLSNVGVTSEANAARLPTLFAMLRKTRMEIAEWGGTQREEDQAEYASMACAVADLTLSMARTTLLKAQALTNDMVGLLRTWAADPDSVAALVLRPEWLLDGWEQICLIWSHAQDDAERRAALIEIVGLIPVMPKEASEWTDVQSDLDAAFRFRRLVGLNEDWRTGSIVFRLIGRNEHFRAVAS
jgi:hypothetical protein